MNFKNILLGVWLGVFALGITACSDDNDGPQKTGMELSLTDKTVSELGESFTVLLEVSGPWTTECDEWLTVSPENGSAGKHTVTVTAETLETGGATSGKVTFKMADGSVSKEVLVMRGEPKPGRKTDSLALVALYRATNGDHWKTRWNLKNPMNTWEEVLLEQVNGEMRVTKVMPKAFGLKGTIPEVIKYMDALRWFSVENNSLSGSFPEFLCDMPQLELITLAGNNFQGELPTRLFELKNLVYLVLHENHFSGKLPDNIGNCSSLRTLWVNNNNLEGEIPASFAQLKEMRFVMMNENHFTGPLPDFTAMDSLTQVELSRNGEFEIIPVPKEDLQSVELKKYIRNGFTGEAPHFKNKPLLENVWLFENHLTSSPKFTNCPKLLRVRVENNPIGTLDASVVTNMEFLEELFVAGCGLTKLPEFTNCPKLKFLVANSNQLTELPESFSVLTGMEECMLFDNQLTSLPDGISNWEVLRHFQAGYNKLTTLPAAIWTLPFYSLSLPCNEIADALPESIAGARNLANLNLNLNHFKGSAAPLTTIYGAQELHCSQNDFSGNFPEGFGKLAALKTLTLDDNDLTGPIPADIARCAGLSILHLYNNKMSGTIPSAVINGGKWCSWQPESNILLQQSGYEFSPFEDPCK